MGYGFVSQAKSSAFSSAFGCFLNKPNNRFSLHGPVRIEPKRQRRMMIGPIPALPAASRKTRARQNPHTLHV
jgi:hypothetical protein